MANRGDYRDSLNHKLLALEDGGYGDFDYDDTDLNFFLEVAVARLYPFVYRRLSETLTLTTYGTNQMCQITPTFPDRVYRIEDATERTALTNWRVAGTDIINLDQFETNSSNAITTVTAYYHDAYAMPDDDVTAVTFSVIYKPLVVLGAQIEALEARQDSGVRGDTGPIGQFPEVPLLDRLIARYDKLRDGLAMGLPGVLL